MSMQMTISTVADQDIHAIPGSPLLRIAGIYTWRVIPLSPPGTCLVLN